MNTQTLAWMEFAFNLGYLIVVFGIAGAMWRRLWRVPSRDQPAARRWALAFALLGTGDLGHIGLKVVGQLAGPAYAQWVGWGGLTTAITVTLFYVLLLDAWRLRFARRFGVLEWGLLAVAGLRLLLLLPPGNEWASLVPPFGWSLARNLPLVVLGVGVMALYLREGRRPGRRSTYTIGVLIAISFLCYAPVILLVQEHPLVGLFMIPKTVAYLAMGFVAYFGMFRSPRDDAGSTRGH